jgi:F-type H+-transporting ATPase subunit delta
MKLNLIADRIAETYLGCLSQTLGRKRTLDEIESFREILAAAPELTVMLAGPAWSDAEKAELIDSIFAKKFSAEFVLFLKLAAGRGRAAILPGIVDRILALGKRETETEAVLTSAYPIDPATAEAVRGKLEERLKKKLRLTCARDPSLIGGARALVGATQFDGTLRARLDDLRDNLRSTTAV